MNDVNQTNENTKRPVIRRRLGLINASIWPRVTDKGTFHNVSFERRYKDAEGKWQSSLSFNQDELLILAKLIDRVHSEICPVQSSEM